MAMVIMRLRIVATGDSMKKNFPITQFEHSFDADEQLISSTDLAGVIDYSNEAFAKIAGFSIPELIGESHNVVRHPHMPQAAFSDMWLTLKEGRPWMGIVQNRSKDGGSYWVDAYVTPVYENDKCVGYESVRVLPRLEDRGRAERVYKRLGPAASPDGSGVQTSEQSARTVAKLSKVRWLDSVVNRMLLTCAVGFLSIAALVFLPLPQFMGSIVTLVIGSLSLSGAWILARPLNAVDKLVRREVVDNPLMQTIYSGKRGEPGRIELAIRLLQAGQRTILGRLGEESKKLRAASQASAAELGLVVGRIDHQHDQTDQVATAMNEMAATVADVARNSASAAEAACKSKSATEHGDRLMSEFSAMIEKLADQINVAAEAMETLLKDSEKIYKVTDLITQIAEQTNLLALNASIEAARAGEHGRGFAVVASEVSDLAKKTQEATSAIRTLLESFKQVINQNTEDMRSSKSMSDEGVLRVRDMTGALAAISESVKTISHMNAQIATAAEEQSAVAGEINVNIVNIRKGADSINESATKTRGLSDSLICLSDELDLLITRFGRGK